MKAPQFEVLHRVLALTSGVCDAARHWQCAAPPVLPCRGSVSLSVCRPEVCYRGWVLEPSRPGLDCEMKSGGTAKQKAVVERA